MTRVNSVTSMTQVTCMTRLTTDPELYLAHDLVCPPRHGGCPGDLEGDADEDDAEVGHSEVDEEQDHPVLVLVDQPLPQEVQERVGVGNQPNHLGQQEGEEGNWI